VNRVKRYHNAEGMAVSRNGHLTSWAIRQKLCLCCFQPGHVVTACTSRPVPGSPPGYEPPPR
jgi:hypothetical protein